jgi:Fic family protein
MNLIDRAGIYMSGAAGEAYKVFIPKPLPPDPPIKLDSKHHELLEKSTLALGRLDGVAAVLPDVALFLYFYVRKEALLSSQIEGTQSSFSDLLLFESSEAPGVPLRDVEEVSNYVAALNHGLKRLHEGFPLSLRLIREIHKILLSKGRGSSKEPGEFRRTQNWVGGSRPGNALFVPPPPEKVMGCMGDLEKYLHSRKQPVLIKAALAHVQFETIHPFLDGNGRLGRLLITFLFCAEGMLKEPLLYLSLFLKTHRDEYYELLQRVRTRGDWEGWLAFFLTGVHETAEQAVSAARTILRLFETDAQKIATLKRPANSAMRIHQLMQKHPIISIPRAVEKSGMTYPTVKTAMQHLERLGLVKETTGKGRNRLFVYNKYVKILSEGTEPIR